jgi:hypothetical protein
MEETAVQEILHNLAVLLAQQTSLISALTQTFTAACSNHQGMLTKMQSQLEEQQRTLQVLLRQQALASPSSSGTFEATPNTSQPYSRQSRTPSPMSSFSRRPCVQTGDQPLRSKAMTSTSTTLVDQAPTRKEDKANSQP